MGMGQDGRRRMVQRAAMDEPWRWPGAFARAATVRAPSGRAWRRRLTTHGIETKGAMK